LQAKALPIHGRLADDHGLRHRWGWQRGDSRPVGARDLQQLRRFLDIRRHRYRPQRTGDYSGAAEALQEALDICRDIGDRLGQATALGFLGVVRRLTGDYPGAGNALGEALDISREIGDRGGEVETLNDMGALYRVRGDLEQANTYHRQALELAREIGSPWDEAEALAGLGRCALAAGRPTEAEDGLRQSQGIFQRIGATAEIAGLATELDTLTLDEQLRASADDRD